MKIKPRTALAERIKTKQPRKSPEKKLPVLKRLTNRKPKIRVIKKTAKGGSFLSTGAAKLVNKTQKIVAADRKRKKLNFISFSLDNLVSSDFVPSSLEESIQLLDSLEKPPKSEKSNSKVKSASKTSKITNHILNSAEDLNISHGDITNEQESGSSSTEPSTIDLIWKSTVESAKKRSLSHSRTKLWSFMNLQNPAVYRINPLGKINVAYQLGFKSTNGSENSNIFTNLNGSTSSNGSSGNEKRKLGSTNRKRKSSETRIERESEEMKKWNGTCHVFQVDTSNGKTWKPLCDTSAGLTVQISGIFQHLHGTRMETDPTQEIELTHESIVACTSAKFVQLNAAENGQVFGFGFRKEDDRQTFQNIIQTVIDECKVTSTFKPAQPNNESRLREEIDRLRQRQLLRDDEIKDLRNKNLKLELEIKEKAQRERNHEVERDTLTKRNEKLEEEIVKVRNVLKQAEEEIRRQDQAIQEQAVLSDPEILRKLNNSLSIFSDAMTLARQKSVPSGGRLGDGAIGTQLGIAKNETDTEINQNSF